MIYAIFTGFLELAGVGGSRWFVKVAGGRNIFERVINFLGTLVFTPIAGVIGVFIGAAILQLLIQLIVGGEQLGLQGYLLGDLLHGGDGLGELDTGHRRSLGTVRDLLVGCEDPGDAPETTSKAVLVVLIPIGVVVLLGLLILLIARIRFVGGR